MANSEARWSNASVLSLIRDRQRDDPVEIIVSESRQLALDAIDQGWQGPPYDPVELARMRGIGVVANENVADARTVPLEGGDFQIEFNPNRPAPRVRFSIAHEIAHTLFPDATDEVRHRHSRERQLGDDWQLEMLCNMATAEIAMPIGVFPDEVADRPSIDLVVELRGRLLVSHEAIVLRQVNLTDSACIAFSASKVEQESGPSRFRVDYAMSSHSWDHAIPPTGSFVVDDELLSSCTAIGFTAKGNAEFALGLSSMSIECIGVPSFSGRSFPRIIGFVIDEDKVEPSLVTVVGDVLRPRGEGPFVVAHVVNDKARTWGGSGIAAQIRKRWPIAHQEFTALADEGLKLGKTIQHQIDEDLYLVDMVAQRGYGKNASLKYGALQACLSRVAEISKANDATVHLPRIGASSGANWSVIRQLVESTVCSAGIQVTVYDYPANAADVTARQESLFS